MNPDPHAATRPCPDCGAANPDGAAACWLCHRPLAGATESAAPKSISAPQLGDLPTHGPVLRVVLMLTLILVALGLFLRVPRIGHPLCCSGLTGGGPNIHGNTPRSGEPHERRHLLHYPGNDRDHWGGRGRRPPCNLLLGISREEPGSGQPVPEAGRNSIVLLAIALVYSAAFLLWVRILRLRRK